jgi:nickel-dependent lactate racemase
MNLRLAYGQSGLPLELPDDWDVTVIEPRFTRAILRPEEHVLKALHCPIASPPLAEWVRPGDRVGIVFSDITRPLPRRLLLDVIIGELGLVPGVRITFFNALGTHRPNTEAELREMLGDSHVNEFRIVQNDAYDPSTQARLGTSSFGHEIWVNRELVACDAIILTGFIEPHLFAGFSGGGKAVMPGMAGQRTVLGNHDAGMIGHAKAIWGVTRENPIWEETHEITLKVASGTRAGGVFLVNVTLNRDKDITGVFCGGLDEAHAEGCAFIGKTSMVSVESAFDIVVTTNSGYPLDLNVYQAVKGISAAARIVKKGGAIVCAAECREGVPGGSEFSRLLGSVGSPDELVERILAPGFLMQDQWQAHILALIARETDVYLYSDKLSDAEIAGALLLPCRDILRTLAELRKKHGLGGRRKTTARICVLPEGPQTIPFIKLGTQYHIPN